MSTFEAQRTKTDLTEARDILAENKLLCADASENHRNTVKVGLLIKLERIAQAVFGLGPK